MVWIMNLEKLKKLNIDYFNIYIYNKKKTKKMKSVLISVDFIYKEDGTLHPTELNTSTKDELSIDILTNENFISEVGGYFDHELLDYFMINNNLTKIITISAGGDDRLFKAFCNYYSYEFESIFVGHGQMTVPEIEDSNDTLIIRIAYDTYALIDDLYARDNYEFHNLIKDEPFSSPVTFTENNFDTISEFESSQDGTIPNYVIKARTPGYIPTDYPKGYRLDNINELNSLKQTLGDDEFIQKYEFNSTQSLINNRTHHLRTMSLVCGSNLDVLNLIHYKSLNPVSTQNNLLLYDSEVDSNKKLDNLFLSKYYPTWYSKNGLNYHSDSTDNILKPDDTLVSFSELQLEDEVKNIFYQSDLNDGELQDMSQINNFTLGISNVKGKTKVTSGIFVNITATHEDYGTFDWYDGVGNTYLIRKPNISVDQVLWSKGGNIEVGDEILLYNKSSNTTIPFLVQNISFDIKDLDLFLISLSPKPQFMVQLDENNTDLYLVQHNACDTRAGRCFSVNPLFSCQTLTCSDCGKNSPNCQNCGGTATTTCNPPV